MPKYDPNARTALYRLLAANGRLLYVGIAGNPDSRWGQHSTNQPWWNNVADRKVEWFPNRAAAAEAEVKAIKEERPLHNKQHANPVQRSNNLPFRWAEGRERYNDVPPPPESTPAETVANLAALNDLNAERIVIGSMLRTTRAIRDAKELLKAEDYYRPAHELIHTAAVELFEQGLPVTPTTVANELLQSKTLTQVGGPTYLEAVARSVESAANCGNAAAIVRSLSLTRKAAGGY